MTTPLLRLQKISKYYTGEQFVVLGLNNISLSFSRGEFVAVTGESGSGKSTLTHILAGVLPYEAGELYVNEKPTSHYDGSDWERYRCENVSLISQNYGILPGATVWSNVISALVLTGMQRGEAAVEAEKILKKVELWEMRKRRAAKLSSGQKQRLSVARALAKPAPILLADEPTGNLDPENSAKVIALLAEAAKDRLVVLITHEFSEAEALATRHIVLQDGSVIMDAPLREPYAPDEPQISEEPEAPAKPKRAKKEKKRLGGYVAALQMRARPVWSVIMLLFFSVTALAVFVFLGTFLSNLDDNSTRIYDDTAFRNGDQNRIVVQRLDGSNFTDADMEVLSYVPNVRHIERYGYVADINYFYREDQDYYFRYTHTSGSEIGAEVTMKKTLQLSNYSLFVQTVPSSAEGFLTDGRMPENFYEAVSGDPALLGQTITVYLSDANRWSPGVYIEFQMEIVGTTDRGEHLYFHDDVGMMVNGAVRGTARAFASYFTKGIAYFAPSKELSDGQVILSANKAIRIGLSHNIPIAYDYITGDQINFSLAGTHEYALMEYILVSEQSFKEIVPQNYADQVTLYVTDYAYVDCALDVLGQMGYNAMSPYRTGSQTIDETLSAERMNTLRLCLIVLVAVLLLQVIVLRALFSTQTENYRLLSNIGLSCREAKLSILWQFLAFTAAGQLVGLAGIYAGNALEIERIVSLVRYLPAEKAVILSLTHLIAALLSAWWVMRALRKSVYPFSQQSGDLNWKELEEASAQ